MSALAQSAPPAGIGAGSAGALASRQPPLVTAIVAVGAAWMALLAFGLVLPPDYPFFGARLYDHYARALLSGHFDLPVRALRIEGHFTPGGTGYLYHGLGPVLTRLPFAPFVELPTSWISPLSIWLWAVIGNACWHRAFALGLERADIVDAKMLSTAQTLLAAAVWFAAPGILLVANGTVYYEPVAMAYALGSGVMLLVVRLAMGRTSAARAVLPMAALAGLALHARPHLAVGFYMATCLIALGAARRGGRSGQWRAGAAVGVLGLVGAALLASNAARFGGISKMHGSFSGGDVQYGTVYWGFEDADGARAEAFRDHGRFHAGRIVPGVLAYVLMPPEADWSDPAVAAVERLHARMTAPFGYSRMERPRVGTLFLWPLWMALMCVGLARREVWRMPVLAGMAGGAVGALLLLSYPTITLRYHVDLWPLIALPAVFGIAPVARAALAGDGRRAGWIFAVPILLLAGFAVSGDVVGASRNLITEKPGTLSQGWSREYCLARATQKGFAGEKAAALCRLGDDGENLQ